jgi:hypothetical protein
MDKRELEKKMEGKIVKVEPITTGRTRGKLHLYFEGGGEAIFKPAWGERGGPSTEQTELYETSENQEESSIVAVERIPKRIRAKNPT